MLLRFIVLTVLAWCIWRLLDRLVDASPRRPKDAPGAAPPVAELRRCGRCGVLVPAPELLGDACNRCRGTGG